MLKCDAMPTIFNVQSETLKDQVKSPENIVSKIYILFSMVNRSISFFQQINIISPFFVSQTKDDERKERSMYESFVCKYQYEKQRHF